MSLKDPAAEWRMDSRCQHGGWEGRPDPGWRQCSAHSRWRQPGQTEEPNRAFGLELEPTDPADNWLWLRVKRRKGETAWAFGRSS